MHLWVKKLKVEIFTQTSLQSFPPGSYHHQPDSGKLLIPLRQDFSEKLFFPNRKVWMTINDLFIFNFFNVDKFISITTRIAFHKQQDQSQTPRSVNKIAECWYPWYQTFETKSLFVVLIKVNPKLKKQQKKQTNKKKHATNWQLTLYHNEEK